MLGTAAMLGKICHTWQGLPFSQGFTIHRTVCVFSKSTSEKKALCV